MAAIRNQPDNPNMLHKNKFRFVLTRAPNVDFWSQSAKVPGMTLAVANQITPFTTIPRPGGKVEFETFNLTFKVDEDMRNYLEIFDWIVNLGFVNDMKGYGNIQAQGQEVVSDATLMLMTSKENGNIAVTFKNMFPISLTELEFDLKEDEINFHDVTVTFQYQSFTVERIVNTPQ